MFSGLRLRLTLLYLGVALALLVLLGFGTYQIIRSYFQMTTDLALQHKMAHEFQMHGAPLPLSLTIADRDWSLLRDGLLPAGQVRPYRENPGNGYAAEVSYDGELAAIFVLPLSSDGRLLFDPNPYTPPIAPDREAVAAALTLGSDWRTIRTADGSSVRLLTYRMTRSDGPAVLQLGRTLNDQDR
ncbi:MAG: histidine kinase, partial [Chloroflexales bacterium]|nr:histidine kinase [Chloroflexales bacterium]